MRFTSRHVVALVTALVLSGQVRGQSVSVLLQKGIFAEETTGDLDAAIKIYQQILTRDQADRANVARAQYRLGVCYTKKGQTAKATAAFEKLIERFPQQAAHVAQARARLAELGRPAEPTARRVVADFGFTSVPSRDGKYLAYTEFYTGNLGIHELATGKNRLLVDDAVKTLEKSAYAVGCVFSPDGDQIAYMWVTDWFGGVSEVRIISVQGGEPRTVYRMPDDEGGAVVLDWSSDPKFLLILTVLDKSNAQRSAGRTAQLALVNVTDGSLRVLKTLSHPRGVQATLSPNGKLVAYSARPNAQSLRRDVYLISLEDGKERVVVQHPADDILVGWAPDGGQIVFASDRSGTKDLWTLDVVGENSGKRARLVRTGFGHFTPLGITADGTLYYQVRHGSSNVYTAPLDPETGKLVGAPKRAIRQNEGYNWAPAWSPDGRYLACLVIRYDAFYLGPRFQILDLETGRVRELVVTKLEAEATNVYVLRWSPDGNSLLVYAQLDGRWGAQRVDVVTGEVTTLAQRILPGADWSRDGTAIFVTRHKADGFYRRIRINLETRREEEVRRSVTPRWGSSRSPDGRHFVYRQDKSLVLLPVNGGEPRTLFQPFEGNHTHTWMPDGRHIIFTQRDQEGRAPVLWRIAIDGGKREKLGTLQLPRRPSLMRVHPDGTRIAFQVYTPETPAEVWVLENFLTRPKTSK